MRRERDAVADVLVIGSGAAGLVGACVSADFGLRTTVLEAEQLVGGTSAISGGQMWLPGHHSSVEDEVRTYLGRVVMGATPDALVDAFLVDAPQLAAYLEGSLGMPLLTVNRWDYHPTWAGAGFARTVEPMPVDTKDLGSWASLVVTTPHRRPVTSVEARDGLDEQVIRDREREGVRTQGAGLVAGLLRAARHRGVDVVLGSRVVKIDGAPGSWQVNCADGSTRAAAAVVIAAGGFASNRAMRRNFLPLTDIVSNARESSKGDGLLLAASLGGQLRRMDEAWWMPAVIMRDPATRQMASPRGVVRELAFPGSIMVNRYGHRFVNEASSYNDLGKAFLRFDASTHRFPNEEAWLIFDDAFRRTRTVAGVAPGAHTPEDFIHEPSLTELAASAGIDPDGLLHTIRRHNAAAASGTDADFGRGSDQHDRFNGDDKHSPNPCLGPIGSPPFYALRVRLGANGTKGGVITNEHAAVLDGGGAVIPGLFAVGESAAALMGPGYAGAGASLGPGMTAAYSLRHALQALPVS